MYNFLTSNNNFDDGYENHLHVEEIECRKRKRLMPMGECYLRAAQIFVTTLCSICSALRKKIDSFLYSDSTDEHWFGKSWSELSIKSMLKSLTTSNRIAYMWTKPFYRHRWIDFLAISLIGSLSFRKVLRSTVLAFCIHYTFACVYVCVCAKTMW